jgi:hypothetical protein
MNKELDLHKLKVLAGVLPEEDLYDRTTLRTSFTNEYAKQILKEYNENNVYVPEEDSSVYTISISGTSADITNVKSVLKVNDLFSSQVLSESRTSETLNFGRFNADDADYHYTELYRILKKAMNLDVRLTVKVLK